MDKAGAYGIQHKPEFLDHIDGNLYTIMGLPIIKLLKIFRHCGIVN